LKPYRSFHYKKYLSYRKITAALLLFLSNPLSQPSIHALKKSKMKKIILAAAMLFAINSITTAQNVGMGTNTPNASALLDVTATNKGVLIPRVTNAQMIAITTPADGLLIYNTDSAAFAYRTATAWVFIKGNSTASNDWSTQGNAGTNAATHFIGTTDDMDLVFKRNNLRAGLINESDGNTGWGVWGIEPCFTWTEKYCYWV
jgi:hypothetical protein